MFFFFLLLSFACCVQTAVRVTKITDPIHVGEGPHWDDKQQALYFVDSKGCSINKYVPKTGSHTNATVGGRVGFMVPIDGTTDQFLVGVERKFQVVRWNGADGSPASVLKTLGEVDDDVPANRINDGKADPRGRVFAGTMDQGEYPNYELYKSSLFRLDGAKITKVVDRISVSNGLAWDLCRKVMYYTDSLERKIRRYDYDVETGRISNLKYIFDFKKNKINRGYGDGLTIDTDGNLWVAVFDGSSIIKINPSTGKLLQKVLMPAVKVTSVTFGGPNYDILFVTSGVPGDGPQGGATFMVAGLGVKGFPNMNFKL